MKTREEIIKEYRHKEAMAQKAHSRIVTSLHDQLDREQERFREEIQEISTELAGQLQHIK